MYIYFGAMMLTLDELRTRYKQIKRELVESPGDYTLEEKLQQIEGRAKQLQQGYKKTEKIYDAHGFDQNGFDKDGYNKAGEDQFGFNRSGENMHPHEDPEIYHKPKTSQVLDKSQQTIGFGKHKGKKWKEAPLEYLTWILGKNFSPHIKSMAQYGIDQQRK